MELSEIEDNLSEFWKLNGIEEYFLKYPIDMILDFNKTNIKEKLIDNTIQINNFKKLLLKAELKYKEFENVYQISMGEQYNYYKNNTPSSDSEIENYHLAIDSKIIGLKQIQNKLKTKRDFFKTCIDTLIIQGERMHDYIKIIEIEKQF